MIEVPRTPAANTSPGPSKSALRSVGALGAGVIVVLALVRAGGGAGHRLLGNAAPSFTSEIVAGEGLGDRIDLDSLRGRVVVLDFWASWCPPCRASIPILGTLADEQGPDGAIVYGVNVEANRTDAFVADAHRALGARFPSLIDRDFSAQDHFGVEAYPTLYVIDRHGVVRDVHVGVPDLGALRSEVQALLAEAP